MRLAQGHRPLLHVAIPTLELDVRDRNGVVQPAVVVLVVQLGLGEPASSHQFGGGALEQLGAKPAPIGQPVDRPREALRDVGLADSPGLGRGVRASLVILVAG